MKVEISFFVKIHFYFEQFLHTRTWPQFYGSLGALMPLRYSQSPSVRVYVAPSVGFFVSYNNFVVMYRISDKCHTVIESRGQVATPKS